MTEVERLLQFFQMHGYQVTLGQLLAANFYKATARISDLRKRGHSILCERNHENPTLNRYRMFPQESNGQTVFA